jgi:hypothetical protein
VTGSALVAAFSAAQWAAQTYKVALETLNLERSRILVERFVSEGEVPPGARVIHVALIGNTITFYEPASKERVPNGGGFDSMISRFDSIGRAEILDADAEIVITLDGKELTKMISLGSLARDGFVFVRVWALAEGGALENINWRNHGITPEINTRGEPGFFFSPEKQQTRYRGYAYSLRIPK